MRVDGAMRLEVPPSPRSARQVRESIVGFARTHALCDEATDAFVTALSEALANAIEHSGTSESIEVTCWLKDEQMLATVVDRGIGFVPPPAAEAGDDLASLYCERGRGIPIMRSCTDVLSVQSAPAAGPPSSWGAPSASRDRVTIVTRLPATEVRP